MPAAQSLFSFADTYRGVSDGQTFYVSSGYWDDLAWAAIWLYKATNNSTYLDKVPYYMAQPTKWGSSPFYDNWTVCWDSMYPAVSLMYAKITGDQQYKDSIKYNLDYWLNSVPATPGGLKFLNNWGALRYAGAAAYLAFNYAKTYGGQQYADFATNQLHYIMGTNPRSSSYICGWGVNPPKQPHHRAAHGWSGWDYFNNNTPSKYVLTGALVGGPDINDAYTDNIKQCEYSEVALDYQVSLVGALAAKLGLGALPTPEPSPTPSPSVTQMLDDFEAGITGWYSYYGGGSTVSTSPATGNPGTALSLTYSGAYSGYWGVGRDFNTDWSIWAELLIDTKSTAANGVRAVLIEQGTISGSDGEQWFMNISPGTSWTTQVMPFAYFMKRTDYQPSTQDNNGVLNLNKIKSIQIIQSNTGSTSLAIDNVRLRRASSEPTPASTPTPIPTPTLPTGYNRYRLWIDSVYNPSTANSCQIAEIILRDSGGIDRATGGTVTARGENGSAEGKEKAFDKNNDTKWLDFQTTNTWIAYQFGGGASYQITSYSITSANDAPERDPRDWKLQGSNDGSTWTTLDIRSGETFSSRKQTKTYTIGGGATPTPSPSTLTPAPTSTPTPASTPTPTPAGTNVALNKTATASGYTHSGEVPKYAVDGSTSTKWCATNGYPYWLKLDLGTGYTIKRWVVKHAEAGGEGSDKNTKAFKLQKSSNGSTWTDVDSVTGNTSNITDRNVTPFSSRYIRLYITDAGVDNIARIYEFEVWN